MHFEDNRCPFCKKQQPPLAPLIYCPFCLKKFNSVSSHINNLINRHSWHILSALIVTFLGIAYILAMDNPSAFS